MINRLLREAKGTDEERDWGRKEGRRGIQSTRMRRRRTEENREQMEGMVGDRREKGQE